MDSSSTPTSPAAHTPPPAVQTKTPAAQDPYLIHPSDNPATVLFSPLLQVDNYGPWVRGITKALNAKGKLGFVDGSLQPPTEDPLQYSCWKRCDDLVGSWILNSVQPDIRASCLYADSSFAIWKDLQVRFCQSNAPIIFRLKSAIAAIRQEAMPVSAYYTKLKGLWDQYDSLITPTQACICGASKGLMERLERDRAMEFLQGLHDRFTALRSTILLMEPFPSALRIFNLVQQEEEQQNINTSVIPSIESAALSVQRTATHPYRHPHNAGTTSSNSGFHPSPSGNPSKRPRPFCDHCNRHGHTREKCYRIHGYPSTSTGTRPTAMVAASSPVPGSSSIPVNQHVVQTAVNSLSAEQYSRLLHLLNTSNEDTLMEPCANLAGPSHEASDWSG